jgi:hypothetical protein
MGTWTNPRDWVDGETPTGSQFNTHLRDNLKYIKDAPTFDGDVVVNGTTTANNLNVGANLQVSGAAGVTGNMTVYGSTQLGDAISDYVSINGLILSAPLRNYTETRVAATVSGGGFVCDCNGGTYFTGTVVEATTVVIQNPPPPGRVLGITIIFVGNGVVYPVYWQAPVRWPGGVPPVMTGVSGKRDIVTLLTEDGGTTWYGVIVGQAY